MNTKKITTLALLTTVSLIIFVIESMVPPLIPIAGIKLGLANIITLVVLLNFSPKDACMVTIARITLATIFTGTAISFLYSLLGAALSLATMIIIHKAFAGKYIYITSILGAIAHNIGQLIAAVIMTATPGVIVYFPVLMISGIITGLFTGLCAHYTNTYLAKILRKI